jgi:AAA+ ATPase superfamily predicted ATPase
MAQNPFPIHGVVTRPAFTDRVEEVERIRNTLEEPGAKLLVYGPRRMGKTSALRVAIEDHLARGGVACLADFSTATSHGDLANRVLTASTQALGRRWKDIVHDLSRRIGLTLEVSADPVTGGPTASLGFGMRSASRAAEQETLGRVLDSLDGLCEARGVSLGLILDEFQEIHRLGGEEGEWHLRGVIQHHRHISYVAAGSQTHLIQRMMGKGAAFYRLFDVLSFGPMDLEQLRSWVNDGMGGGGVKHQDIARWILALAGERTRDVAQLARKTFHLARKEGRADAGTVKQAFLEIIADESEPLRALWASYAGTEEKVLRAVATGTESLMAADTLQRFGLASSAAASKAAANLVAEGVLVQEGPGNYRFDSPFQRGWVIQQALPDAGIHLPPTHPVEL